MEDYAQHECCLCGDAEGQAARTEAPCAIPRHALHYHGTKREDLQSMQKDGMMPGRCDRVLLGVYLMTDKHAATVDCQALRRNNAGTPKPPCLRCHVLGQPLCQRCKNVWDEETGAFLQFVVAWLCCDAVTMDGVSDSTACIAQGGLPLVLCVAPPVGEAWRSLCAQHRAAVTLSAGRARAAQRILRSH
jgi:hypothetical protein